MSIPVFVLQVRVSVKHHQAAFTFQAAHKPRDAHMRQYGYQHMMQETARLFDEIVGK